MPHLMNYDEALQWEAKVEPLKRGKNKGLKPFANRSNVSFSIRKDENDAIHVRLYNTDITTFHPDGLIVMRLEGWPTQTTCLGLAAVHGQSFFIHDYKVWTARWDYEEHECGNRQSVRRDLTHIKNHGDTVFQRIGKRLIPVEQSDMSVHNINRTEANNVRQKYKPFRDYLTNFLKVRESTRVSPQEIADVFGLDATNNPITPVSLHFGFGRPSMTEATKFVRLIDPTEREEQHIDYYKAALWLLSSGGHSANVLNNLLMYVHRDTVFKRVPMGDNLRRDAYRHFFD